MPTYHGAMLLNVAAYHFARIDAPAALADRLREACEAVGLFVKIAIWAVVLIAAWYWLGPHLAG